MNKKKSVKEQSIENSREGKKTLNQFFNYNFKESLIFFNRLRNYFLFSLTLFMGVFLLGFIFPTFFQEQILNLIEDLIKQTAGLGSFDLTGFIMFNNLKSAFFSMVFGILLGIFPLLVIVLNGYVLGFVAHSVVDLNGGLVLWRLLPHGVFEIPAIMIASGLGLYLGISWVHNTITFFNKKISKTKAYLLILLAILFFPIAFLILVIISILKPEMIKLLWANIKNALKVFIFIVVPLLVIAAIIEGWLIWVLK